LRRIGNEIRIEQAAHIKEYRDRKHYSDEPITPNAEVKPISTFPTGPIKCDSIPRLQSEEHDAVAVSPNEMDPQRVADSDFRPQHSSAVHESLGDERLKIASHDKKKVSYIPTSAHSLPHGH
jgi:hypothetical protein